MSIKKTTNSILSLISKLDSNKDKFPGTIFYKAIDNYLNRYNNMKRVLFPLIACFFSLSANSQVLNLYLKGGVLPVNTYDIDSIRLVPEQEIPKYDVKSILTSAEDGWVCESDIAGFDIINFTHDGKFIVTKYTKVYWLEGGNYRDSLVAQLSNSGSYLLSDNNEFLVKSDKGGYQELELMYADESKIVINTLSYEKNSPEVVDAHRKHQNFIRFLGEHLYLYNVTKTGSIQEKSAYSLNSLGKKVISQGIVVNNNILFISKDSFSHKYIDILQYDDYKDSYLSNDGSIIAGIDPVSTIFDQETKQDSLIIEMCSPKVQDAINLLENKHLENFPSQGRFLFGWGKSSESGGNYRTGICLKTQTATSAYSIAVSGNYSDSFDNISIYFYKDDEGNYDCSSNYKIFANNGMGDALNEVVSLFEGEFRKEPAYLTSTPGYFKLISTSDPDIYFTWYIR